MVVLLQGAHPAARKPLVEVLLEGHAPGDPEAPCVRVCFSPHELLDVPVGARVVLVGAERAPEWLNIHRPVVWERELVLLLWVEDGALEHMRRNAPDFLDWVSHRVEVPWFAPERAMAELVRAHLVGASWIAAAGAELVALIAEGATRIDANSRYDDLASAMEGGDVLIRGLHDDGELWRLLIAHAEVRWCHRVVLAEPRVLPPFAWIIDARLEDWEQSARRLESLGVEHPPLMAAIESSPERAPFARVLAIDEAHLELLGRVAREQVDDATVRLALALGLDDVAEGLGPGMWSDEMTPERIDQGLRGGLRDRRALADYVRSMVEQGAMDELARRRDALSLLPDVVQNVLEDLYRDGGHVLRAWDPTHETFERYLRRLTKRRVVSEVSLRDGHRQLFAAMPPTPGEEPGPDLDVEIQTAFDRVVNVLDADEQELLDDIARGRSVEEIARRLRVTTDYARKRKLRLIRKLRTLLEKSSSRRR